MPSRAFLDSGNPMDRRMGMRRRSQNGLKKVDMTTAIVACLGLLVSRQAFAAPIRYYAPWAWYIPDIVMVVTLAIIIMKTSRRHPLATVGLYFITLSWGMSSVLLYTGESILFSIRLIGACTVGMAAGLGMRSNSRHLVPCLALLGAGCTIGVLEQYASGTSWAGLSFEGAIRTTNVTREWWRITGAARLAGLGMSSTDTALIISACTLLGITHLNFRIRAFSAGILPFSLYAVWLTQQLATLTIFVALGALALMSLISRSEHFAESLTRLLKALVLSGAALVVMAPLLLTSSKTVDQFLSSAPSLQERALTVWPAAIDGALEPKTLLMGRGLGGIGEAASLSPGVSSVVPDNLFLYLVLLFGLPVTSIAVFLLVYLLKRAQTGISLIGPLSVMSLIMFNGVTANVLEGVAGAAFLGLAIGGIWCFVERRPYRQTRAPVRLKEITQSYAHSTRHS